MPGLMHQTEAQATRSLAGRKRAMAVRHHVSNLVLRGNVYYWRPRLPAGTSGSGRRKHLSLSLRITDHARAKSLAMQLNARLEGIRWMIMTEAWDAEQLAILFRDEISRASADLESFAVAGRRVGSPSEDQLIADKDVGWAYRLIAVFGARRSLNFAGDCPGLRYLERLGVPLDRLPFVIDTFRQEQRFRRSPVFDSQMQDHLRDAGLDDGPLMRERAATELARARADVLLDSRSFYPDLAVLDDETGADVTSSEPIGLAPPPAEPEGTTEAGEREMPVRDLLDCCRSYLKGREKEIEKRTRREVVVATFVDILTEHELRSLGAMQQFHLGALRRHFDDILPNYGQSSQLACLGSRELRHVSAERVRVAIAEGKIPPALGLSPQTIRKHLGNLDGFLKYLKAQGYRVPAYELSGLRPKKPKKTMVRGLTQKPGPERMSTIFSMPVFTGCRSAFEKDCPGDSVFHSANFYVPMLLVYLGPRRFEITGLTVRDIVETQNGYGINIDTNSLRRIKNVSSIRMLPMPDELGRLGFIDYVDAIKGLGYQALFPELYDPQHPHDEQDSGDRFYKDFAPLAQAHFKSQEEVLWKRLLHAIRHGHSDTLKQAGVDSLVIDDIAGRFGEGETATRYTNPAGLPLLREKLRSYPSITKHLQPQPINLLPWVAEKRSPPWAE
jgi:integrase